MYADVIFIENLIINYIILYLTKRFSRSNTNNAKLIFSSALGALYVILIFFSLPNIIYSLTFKIIISILMVAIAFGFNRFHEFIRVLSIFYLVSFIIGGTAFALIYVVNIDIRQIIIAALFFAILLTYIGWGYISKKNIESNILYKLHIEMDNKVRDVKAILDTGNTLHDPISNYPVAIVEYDAVKELLPEKLKNVFDSMGNESIFEMTKAVDDDKWLKRLRLVPFNSIGNDSGILIGFIPDNLVVEGYRKSQKNAIVGIYFKKLNETSDYEALIGTELLN
ncbi:MULTISPECIES: sigma-E processing peptidase SpoIIGA [unclassified Thermoanaerobacterium]|uniref:sigma-E processing peptidase SpoIIGA n=1 Tax=unclassified Thermoanaerobacterium TaxID=2622527 RepID=UPI000A14DB42|nr:sigma-E processing peptidase SpoIIGA [Thermoanaerobacterium sp. PSU-2]MDE4542051.1 sigma-E processing peptidase SpoIIGA [Thermoanaerobacterium sp. R66]ORX24021.1 sigma-E processing peptidase SpoIIGA [Thermoanaerobacterium sp. PSU-2]